MEQIKLFYLMLLILAFSSCATTAPGSVQAESSSELPSITKIYATEIALTHTGMSITDFNKIWTEASLESQKGNLIIYEVKNTQRYYTEHDRRMGVLWTGSVKSHSYTQRLLFYFKSGKLTKWVKENIPDLKNQPVKK